MNQRKFGKTFLEHTIQSRLIAFTSVCIVLTGCPYTSTVPAGGEPAEVPKELIGKWIKAEDLSDSQTLSYIEFTSPSKKNVSVREFSFDNYSSMYDTSHYEGQLAIIKGQYFLSLRRAAKAGEKTSPFEEEENLYDIYRIRPFFQYYLLDDLSMNIEEKFSSSVDLDKFIEKHIENELFYGGSTTYMKMPANK